MKTKCLYTLIAVSFLLLNFRICCGQTKALEYKNLIQKIYEPDQVMKKTDGSYFIIFKKTYFGKLGLDLYSAENDTIVVKLGEKAINNLSVDDHPPGTIRFIIDTFILKKGENEYISKIPDFEPPAWARNLNYDIPLPENIGNLTPFRYAEIIGFDGTIKKNQVKQIAWYYPFNDDASFCETSSEPLNQVWDLCKHTIKATTYTGVYIDGDRERRPYEGDTYINQLSHYAVDAEYAINRKTIDHLFKYPTWPTEWEFHMHLILWEDYMYTGNDEYLKLYYPDLKRIVEEVVFDENGLIENTGNNDIIDWPTVERDGYQIGKVNNVPNAFYCKSLELLSQIAGVINKQDDSIYFAEKFLKYKTIFNNVFWDEKNSFYIDAIGNSHSSLHANIFPVAFGLASPLQIQKIIPFIKSKEMAVSVYGAQYLLDALYLISEDEYALKLMSSDNERSWINMINRGGTITWEAWSEKVKGNLDWNHAWGAVPGNIISRRLFGIRPAKPGFQEAIIQPQFAGLKNGKIIQPTINGPVEVKFDNNNSTKLAIEVKLNMPAKIILPVKKYVPASVKLNNVEVKPLVDGEYLVIPISEENNKIIIVKK